MTSSRVQPLHVALASALVLAALAPAASAQAQKSSLRDDRPNNKSQSASKKADGEQKPALYPNATRVSPEEKTSPKMAKVLKDLQELYEKRDMASVIAKTEAITAMPAASNYDKSFADTLAANAAADMDNDAKAAEYFRKAIDSNGLDNDNHYNTMYNLVVIEFTMGNFQEALTTLDRFLTETKSEKTDQLALRASILANLGRYDEAAAAYKALIAKNPDDKRLLMNAVAALQNANKFDEANALLEDAYKRGMLTDGKELRSLYVGYMNAGRWKDAQAVMDTGVSKGLLEASPQLAKDYMILAQNAYVENNLPLAIELYTKAAPMAADGEAYLNLAKVLDFSGKKAEAKVAAQKALDKGVKKPEDAKRILSP